MNMGSDRRRLFATTIIGSLALTAALAAQPAAAQTTSAAATPSTEVGEVVVTGSRIRQAATETTAPVAVVNQQDLTDRGFVTAGQALNDLTSITISQALQASSSNSSGPGQTFANLFNLGQGRTLTLVDGHRYVSSTNPTSGTTGVDTNLIPVGLIDHVDVVQAGGAAVYGSDAIAGVVNFVLKKNFQGVEMDAQTGISSRDDYPENSLRITAGRNFDGDRGNIAIDAEWSKNKALSSTDRPISNLSRSSSGNVEILNSTFYEFNPNGVIFTAPAPTPVCGGQNCFARINGVPQQFSPNGQSLIPYSPGLNGVNGSTALTPALARGGDGLPLSQLEPDLFSGVERYNFNVLSHYDLTDHMKLSGSLLYGRTQGDDPAGNQGFSHTIIGSAASNSSYITFTKANPFLTAADVASLTAASPSFGGGAPLFLSKYFTDLLPTRAFITTTDSYRALVALDGDFSRFGHDFYYSLSYSHGQVDQKQESWGINNAKYNNAINASLNASGQIVCSINAVAVVDPSCAPINPFGATTASAAASQYVSVRTGFSFENKQDDVLGTIGGNLFALPAGQVKFSVAYEHRAESQENTPSAADQAGLTGVGTPTVPTSGSYNTNEYSGELLVPILGEGFNAPGFKTVELSGQYRFVDNSIAGKEDVWGLGLRWEVIKGLTFRASRSRNFRAPTLYQLDQPSSTSANPVGTDPCDNRSINAGSNPTVRAQNCLALFTANPLYGTGTGLAPVGASAAARLASFQDTAQQLATAQITSGGNPALQNEVSDTTTYGVVYQPAWVPGQLTVVVDWINIDLANGLTAFSPANFAQACYDASGASNAACGFFTRDAVGNIATAASTTFNAAAVKYQGETADATYRFPMAWIIRPDTQGNVELEVAATHNEILRTQVLTSTTQIVGTIAEPRWVVRTDVRYVRGPLRLTYEAYYLPTAYAAQGANAANNAHPFDDSNLRQDISASYDFGRFQVRGGVKDLTDKMPSYPTLSYGDILGRQFFFGLKARY